MIVLENATCIGPPSSSRPCCVRHLLEQSYVNSYTEDKGPESATIIPAEYSPSGKALLIGAYEASNSLAVFEIDV